MSSFELQDSKVKTIQTRGSSIQFFTLKQNCKN